MKRFLLSICCFLLSFSHSQEMRIGVFRELTLKRLTFSYDKGTYMILADSSNFGLILPNEYIDLSFVGTDVILKIGTIEKGRFKKITLIQNQLGSSMAIVPKSPVAKQRKYQDNFEITANGKGLTIVNLVDLNNYLAGVVESEGGGGSHLEYYKVQALMSRTYALKYKKRHTKDGFSLCDQVHCQAYHNMLRYTPLIRQAVEETDGIVMIDEKNQLVDAYFHANCGGQTCEPDYIWNNAIPYLNTFVDTFCIHTKQARWEKRVKQSDWQKFLVERYNYPIYDSIMASMLFTFDQAERKAFYINPTLGIPLRDLREKFNLKSTYFSCYPEGNDVVIVGRGFGHGVGLCQEGAMKMARSGYDFQQIALFYFPGIDVVKLSENHYFKQVSRTE